MSTIETSFIMMIVFTTFVTLISFSTRNFNDISNNIRKKQIEYSFEYDTNFEELKNEYDTIVKPKLKDDNPILHKIYSPEFVLRSLSASENLSFLNNSDDEYNNENWL